MKSKVDRRMFSVNITDHEISDRVREKHLAKIKSYRYCEMQLQVQQVSQWALYRAVALCCFVEKMLK